MLNREAAQAIITQINSHVSHYATVNINNSETGTTRFANSEISQNISITDTSVELTVYDGKKAATCSTNILTDDGLNQLVENAESMLSHVPEGEFEAFPMSQEFVAEPVCIGDLAKSFSVEERAAYVKDGVAQVSPGFTAAGALALTRTAIATGDTQGAFRYTAFDNIAFNTVITHEDGTAGAGECYSYTDVPDIKAAFKKAQATAQAARNPVGIDLGAYTVVLSPLAFGDLIGFMTYMLNAESVDEGASFARGKLGQRVFGENITVRDDVRFPGLRPLYFDYEGTPRGSLTLIDKGVVSSYLYDNKTAARHKVRNTGHAVSNDGSGGVASNLLVEGGSQTLAEIIASTDKGIFINEFHYTNFVNMRNLQITGLTRNGAFLIENGKLASPITTMRFTQSLLDAFNSVTALSSERENISNYYGSALMPAARIEGFHFTSKP
jgi:predicted Zn-dependent protease